MLTDSSGRQKNEKMPATWRRSSGLVILLFPLACSMHVMHNYCSVNHIIVAVSCPLSSCPLSNCQLFSVQLSVVQLSVVLSPVVSCPLSSCQLSSPLSSCSKRIEQSRKHLAKPSPDHNISFRRAVMLIVYVL